MNPMTFKALFEHASIGIIFTNPEGDIIKCNPYALKLFGYSEEEIINQKIEVLIPPKIRKKHVTYREEYNLNPSNRAMGVLLNVEAIKKDKSKFSVEISLSHFTENNELRIVSFINDITDRKKAEKALSNLANELESKVTERTNELSDALVELNNSNKIIKKEIEAKTKMQKDILVSLEKEKELNKLKSRFVSMASHEFRTPLAGILTSASLLSKYNSPDYAEKHDKHITTIKKLVKNLTNILNEFLSLDKLDQGSIKSHSTKFELSPLVEEIVERMQESSEKNQIIDIKHQNKSIELYQDKDILRNIIINLLSNAMKYSPDKSTIYLETLIDKSKLILRIKDNGIGIPEADQRHLFERFFRAHNANTIKGTGLGLNIVKSYLDLLAGDVEFTSKENEGTTFTINIPLEKSNETNFIN